MSAGILGIIGGSGVYQIDGLANTRWEQVSSPFGAPSDAILRGELNGQQLAFLPRHGRGHRIPPSELNFRANIDVMKRLGVTDIISVSAVGSYKEELSPGTFVIVDQFIDRTVSRVSSFFGSGLVAHVSMAHPVCNRLGNALESAAKAAAIRYVRGGTYVTMEGPQFSSLAESRMYKSWGCDVIGMTNVTEAKLAREAEICYATVAMVTDYDCWHPNHDAVTVAEIVAVLTANADRARQLVRGSAPMLQDRPEKCPQGCDRSLDTAIMTAPEVRDPELVAKLDAIAGRILHPERK
jgi:5'-methylthioadenosine phosphorylase